MESLYKSLKREELEKYGFKTKSEARLVLVDYLDKTTTIKSAFSQVKLFNSK
jgi:hypothetical protein